MAQDANAKVLSLPLRLTEPYMVVKVLALVYSDESTAATIMGPEGNPLLQYARGMQNKMLGAVAGLLDQCKDMQEVGRVVAGIKAWLNKSYV